MKRFTIKVNSGLDGDYKILFRRCESIEQLMRREWKSKDISGCTIGGYDASGEEFEMPIEQVVEAVRAQGCSAFCDVENRVVHYWIGDASPEDVIEMLGHEIGHIAEKFQGPAEEVKKMLGDEVAAMRYGEVARAAYEAWRRA